MFSSRSSSFLSPSHGGVNVFVCLCVCVWDVKQAAAPHDPEQDAGIGNALDYSHFFMLNWCHKLSILLFCD